MLTREKFVPYLQMIAEIQHISGPTWSEHDVMSLIKTQNDFVNNPLACPITRAKWGTKSNQAILKNLERIRTSENMYLQRYFRVDPETWSPTDMNELNQACQTATFQDVHIPGKSQAAIRCRVEELLAKACVGVCTVDHRCAWLRVYRKLVYAHHHFESLRDNNKGNSLGNVITWILTSNHNLMKIHNVRMMSFQPCLNAKRDLAIGE